jgi:hypothetical protein
MKTLRFINKREEVVTVTPSFIDLEDNTVCLYAVVYGKICPFDMIWVNTSDGKVLNSNSGIHPDDMDKFRKYLTES